MSCYNLYFKRPKPYADKHRRNIRNRAYNIFMKNKYKKKMKLVLRMCVALQTGETTYASMTEVMDDFKAPLDDACYTIDEVCVQGVIHRNTAARRKDRMCRFIFRAALKQGLVEKLQDPFIPGSEQIGYDMPKCYKTREPRPWQLPAWKSPWMLKKEFDKWQKFKEENAKAEA